MHPEIYTRAPMSFRNDIPVFSGPDEYTGNYERIARDHLASLQEHGANPFISEELWR